MKNSEDNLLQAYHFMKIWPDSKYAIVCTWKSSAQSSYNPPALGTNECQTLQEEQEEACQRQTLTKYSKISFARHVERWVHYMPTDNLHIGLQINDEPSWPQVPICDGKHKTTIFYYHKATRARSTMHIAVTGWTKQKSQRLKSQQAHGFQHIWLWYVHLCTMYAEAANGSLTREHLFTWLSSLCLHWWHHLTSRVPFLTNTMSELCILRHGRMHHQEQVQGSCTWTSTVLWWVNSSLSKNMDKSPGFQSFSPSRFSHRKYSAPGANTSVQIIYVFRPVELNAFKAFVYWYLAGFCVLWTPHSNWGTLTTTVQVANIEIYWVL